MTDVAVITGGASGFRSRHRRAVRVAAVLTTPKVLGVQCDVCGFEYGSVPAETVIPVLHAAARQYADHLTENAGPNLRRRPSPQVWSALEYACHVRDVLLVMRERVLQVLREPTAPAFTPMGRDERVEHDRYGEQDPADVARQLLDAAAMLAFVFEGLDDQQWDRTCIYGYPEPAERTLAWVAQQTVHEAEHHLADLLGSLHATSGGPGGTP